MKIIQNHLKNISLTEYLNLPTEQETEYDWTFKKVWSKNFTFYIVFFFKFDKIKKQHIDKRFFCQ